LYNNIQITLLLPLVFCRCFEKNCTLHCNVIYFQTISSNSMSDIFSQPVYVWQRLALYKRYFLQHIGLGIIRYSCRARFMQYLDLDAWNV